MSSVKVIMSSRERSLATTFLHSAGTLLQEQACQVFLLKNVRSIADFGPDDNFNSRVHRQLVGADGDAGMFARFAECLNE
jgi:hypothetical protein